MYLGLNCNQHTFSAAVLDPESGEIVYFDTVHFDDDLAHRDTQQGVVQGDKAGEYGIDPQMLIESMELLFERLIDSLKVDISEITHVTGSASASTIFLKQSFDDTIGNLNPSIAIIEQLRSIYATRFCPTLVDTSAANYALNIKKRFSEKCDLNIRSLTGCALDSGTSAAQINKFQRESEDAWASTTYVHTSSSFLLSILIGQNAPVDLTETSHFCLYNIRDNQWQKNLVEEVNAHALEKLPRVVEPNIFIKNISDYFCAKYGFSPETKCLSWISQEATHAIGMNLIYSGDSNLKLNDAYTFSMVTKDIPQAIPSLAKVTYHPLSGYLTHMVLENGMESFIATLDRLEIEHDEIDAHLLSIPSSTQHPPTLPFVKKEKALIIPAAKQTNASLLSFTRGQILHMKLYSQWIDQSPTKIYLSGRGSVINSLRQLCSNVFQVDCIHIDDTDAHIKGQAILCDLDQDVSKKTIYAKYYESMIINKNSPEPFMANVYNSHLSHYHHLLFDHVNAKPTTTF